MRTMTERLGSDAGLAERYAAAHRDYLARRDALERVPEIYGISAGGMPERVKCLHVLAGHALAAGPGVNPLGDVTLALLPDWGSCGPCVEVDAHAAHRSAQERPDVMAETTVPDAVAEDDGAKP